MGDKDDGGKNTSTAIRRPMSTPPLSGNNPPLQQRFPTPHSFIIDDHNGHNGHNPILNGHGINVSMDYKQDPNPNTSGTSSDLKGSPSPPNTQLQSLADLNPLQPSAQDAIGELVGRRLRVLSKLKQTCHTNTHHSPY